MRSSKALAASIAALVAVIATALTFLVASGGEMDFSDWPRSPDRSLESLEVTPQGGDGDRRPDRRPERKGPAPARVGLDASEPRVEPVAERPEGDTDSDEPQADRDSADRDRAGRNGAARKGAGVRRVSEVMPEAPRRQPAQPPAGVTPEPPAPPAPTPKPQAPESGYAPARPGVEEPNSS